MLATLALLPSCASAWFTMSMLVATLSSYEKGPVVPALPSLARPDQARSVAAGWRRRRWAPCRRCARWRCAWPSRLGGSGDGVALVVALRAGWCAASCRLARGPSRSRRSPCVGADQLHVDERVFDDEEAFLGHGRCSFSDELRQPRPAGAWPGRSARSEDRVAGGVVLADVLRVQHHVGGERAGGQRARAHRCSSGRGSAGRPAAPAAPSAALPG
jgi:hypothetical protein